MKTTTYTFEAGEMKTTVTDRPVPTRERMAEVARIIHCAATRRCTVCGTRKPIGRSCACFDCREYIEIEFDTVTKTARVIDPRMERV